MSIYLLQLNDLAKSGEKITKVGLQYPISGFQERKKWQSIRINEYILLYIKPYRYCVESMCCVWAVPWCPVWEDQRQD